MESPLFNTKKYAQSLELLYAEIWKKYEKGEPSDHVDLSATPTINGKIENIKGWVTCNLAA